MTTVNEYLENTRDNYINTLMVTALFLVLPTIGYLMIHFQKGYLLFYISIFYCTGFLFYTLIKPTYKIAKMKAKYWEMNTLKTAPFGIGLLLCIHWRPYQRMARKLKNAKIIRECKCVLEEMDFYFGKEIQHYLKWFFDLEHGYTREVLGNIPKLPPVKKGQFKFEVNNFCKLFPKIDNSSENKSCRLRLLENMICLMIDFYHNELLNDFEGEIRGVENGYTTTELDIIECLRYERAKFALHRNPDVSERAFKKALDKKVGYLRTLLNDLEEDGADLTVIFNQMKME